MICVNCGRLTNGKFCEFCGTDYRTDEEKKTVECNHIYDSVIYEESPKDMTINLLFRCRNCKHIVSVRTTRDFIRSMIGR